MKILVKACLSVIGPAICFSLLASCTAEQVYNNIQQDHQRQCLQLPIWQQAHCQALNDTPFIDYQRDLDKIRMEKNDEAL